MSKEIVDICMSQSANATRVNRRIKKAMEVASIYIKATEKERTGIHPPTRERLYDLKLLI
jgi:hypothetical protein